MPTTESEPVPQAYELLLDDEPEVEPEGPVTRASWRRIAIVVLAFLLGAAVGIAATVKQRDAAAARERESTASLLAMTAGWPNIDAANRRAQVTIRLLNMGPLPVQLERVRVELPGFAGSEEGIVTRRIEPGETGFAAATTGDADCTAPEPSGPGMVMFTVRLESGERRDLAEPIEAADAFRPHDVWMAICEPFGGDQGVWAYVTASSGITEESGELVVPVELSIEFGGAQDVTLIGVAGNPFIDMRNIDPLGPISASHSFSVQVAVRECPGDDQVARALEDPFMMRVTHGETEMEFPIDTYNPEFLVDVIELIHRVCDE